MKKLIFLICLLIAFNATAQSTNVKVWDGVDAATVTSSKELNVLDSTAFTYIPNISGNSTTIKNNGNLSQGSTTSGQNGNLPLAAVTTGTPSYTTGQSSPLSLTTGGALRVDVSGSSIANENLSQIAGTTTAVNNGAVTNGTIRVTLASDTSGQIICNAGTNLNTSTLALESGGNLATIVTNTNNLSLAQASSTSGQKGNLLLGAATTGSPVYSTGTSNPLSLGTDGFLRVDGTAKNQPVNIRISGTDVSSGNGASGSGTVRVSVANDSTGTIATTNTGTFATQDSQVLADNAGFTDGTSKVWAAGHIYDEIAGTALSENDIGATRMNLNRAAIGIIEDGATRGRWATVTAANALKVDGSAVTQPASLASGTVASGAFASGAYSSGAYASGAMASGSVADGAVVTLGAKTDAKSTSTDGTSITIMQVLKEISAMVQAPPSQAVTNAGTFAVQAAEADGANVTLGAKTDAKNTATDATSITIMQVLKEISAMVQAPAALPANQSVNVAQINGVTPLMGAGNAGTGSHRVTIASDQGAEITWETAVAYAFGSITSSYTTAMTSSNAKRFLKFNNKTDQAVWISFDASANNLYLDAGESVVMDLASDNRYESSNISVKYVTAAPTVRSLYIGAGY